MAEDIRPGAACWDGFPADDYQGLEDVKLKGNRPGVRVVLFRVFGQRQEMAVFLTLADARQLFLGLARAIPVLEASLSEEERARELTKQ